MILSKNLVEVNPLFISYIISVIITTVTYFYLINKKNTSKTDNFPHQRQEENEEEEEEGEWGWEGEESAPKLQKEALNNPKIERVNKEDFYEVEINPHSNITEKIGIVNWGDMENENTKTQKNTNQPQIFNETESDGTNHEKYHSYKTINEITTSHTQNGTITIHPQILPYQKEIHKEIKNTLKDFEDHEWKSLSIKPRWHRLIIGRTGTGKTHIIKALAEEENMPLLIIAASSWIVLGATERGACTTWRLILEFIQRYENGIIFLDEIDKIYHTTDAWSTHLRVEIFQLLDGAIPAGTTEEDPKILAKHLKENFFIIAAGAFQETLEKSEKKSIGFGEKTNTEESVYKPNHDDLAKVLQRELINRFGEMLYLPYPQREDYDQMIKTTGDNLPERLKIEFISEAEKIKEESITNQLGARMLELSISKALRKVRIENTERKERFIKEENEKYDKLKSLQRPNKLSRQIAFTPNQYNYNLKETQTAIDTITKKLENKGSLPQNLINTLEKEIKKEKSRLILIKAEGKIYKIGYKQNTLKGFKELTKKF